MKIGENPTRRFCASSCDDCNGAHRHHIPADFAFHAPASARAQQRFGDRPPGLSTKKRATTLVIGVAPGVADGTRHWLGILISGQRVRRTSHPDTANPKVLGVSLNSPCSQEPGPSQHLFDRVAIPDRVAARNIGGLGVVARGAARDPQPGLPELRQRSDRGLGSVDRRPGGRPARRTFDRMRR